jgi:hypothetical protein
MKDRRLTAESMIDRYTNVKKRMNHATVNKGEGWRAGCGAA